MPREKSTKALPQAKKNASDNTAWLDPLQQQLKQNERHPLKLKYEGEDEKNLASSIDDVDEAYARIFESTGFSDRDAGNILLDQVIRAKPGMSQILNVNSAVAMINGIAPQDPLEGLLAGQMTIAHNLAAEFAKRAATTDFPQMADLYVNRTVKLMNVFARQMETLMKYRQKGQQKIVVQHVQVSEGGQAIIGDVHQGAKG